MRRLLIIPGLGDHDWAYRLTLPIWWLLGFRASVYGYNWQQDDGDADRRLEALLDYLAKQDGPVHVVGGSAGGTVAVTVLLLSPQVERAVAICSPLSARKISDNTVLHSMLARLQASLRHADDKARRRVLSLWCQRDTVVDPKLTIVRGSTRARVPGGSHAQAIAWALTCGSGRIANWLRARAITN